MMDAQSKTMWGDGRGTGVPLPSTTTSSPTCGRKRKNNGILEYHVFDFHTRYAGDGRSTDNICYWNEPFTVEIPVFDDGE
jgi:hypothetical protein